jgi:hypothetical protein
MPAMFLALAAFVLMPGTALAATPAPPPGHMQATVTAPFPDGIRLDVPRELAPPRAPFTPPEDAASLAWAVEVLRAGAAEEPGREELDTLASDDLPATGALGAVRVRLGAAGAVGAGEDSAHSPTPEDARQARDILRRDAEARRPYLAAWGLADVTHPFFGADPSGRADSTKAIQKAVEFARDQQLACYFPSGTYLVSGTIDCVQNLYLRSDKLIGGAPLFPCVLLGDRTPGQPRPRLVLAQSSPGFADPGNPRPVVHFWARGHPRSKQGTRGHQSNINYNQVLSGIDIEIRPGNPGAVGVEHIGAQGSSVQDVAIDCGEGYAGLITGLGAGGSMAGVRVTGGEVGIEVPYSESSPTMAGITLLHQRRAAIVYEGAQALSAVGVSILKEDPRPAIVTRETPHQAHKGQICLTDSAIQFTGEPGTAVATNDSLYLLNVYVNNAVAVASTASGPALAGEPGEWLRVREFALPLQPRPFQNIRYASVAYVDGRPAVGLAPLLTPGAAPPPDLQARHRWPADLATWQTPGAANVKAGYGARGDGKADDTAAIQRALDENDVVFLPKGYYRITQTLQLHDGSRLVGPGRHLAWIVVTRDEGDFASRAAPAPMLRTAKGPEADNQLNMFGLFVPRERSGTYALQWDCGQRSLFKDVTLRSNPLMGFARAAEAPRWDHPLVQATGGGKWYGFYHMSAREQGRNFRHLLINRGNNTFGEQGNQNGPLRIYHLNVEHARSLANAEITNSRDVAIYGMKVEGNVAALRIDHSADVLVLGYGGNASALPGKALFLVESSTDYILSNLVEFPRIDRGTKKSAFGVGVHPDKWHMVSESGPALGVINLPPRDRPVLYRRGEPSALKE